MNLEFFIRMRDMMSGGLVKMASTAQNSFGKVQNFVNGALGRNKALSGSFDEISRKIAQTEQVIRSSTIPSQIRAARSELEKLQKLQAKHQGNLNSGGSGSSGSSGGGGSFLGGILKGNLITSAVTKVVAGAGIAASSIFGGGVKAEQDIVGLKTFLGEKGAKETYANIKKDAAATHFDTESLLMSNRALISAGASAQQARQDTMNLANAVAAVGGGSAELSRMAANMQQIKTVGKASAMDVKQFGIAGINIYQMLADATGKSISQVKEMDVSYELLSMALAKASKEGGIYAGALEAQSKTVGGKYSTFIDGIKEGFAAIGIALQPFMHKLLDIGLGLVSAIPKIMEAISPLVDFLNTVPVDGMLTTFMDTLKKLFVAVSPIIEQLKTLFIGFFQNMPPIGALLDGFISTISIISNVVAGVMAELQPLFISLWESMWPVVMKIRELITQLFVKLGPSLTMIASIVSSVLGPAFKLVGNIVVWLIDLIIKVVDFIAPIIEGIVKFIKWVIDGISDLLGLTKKSQDFKGGLRTAPSSVTPTEANAPGGDKLTDMKPVSPVAPGADDTTKGITSGGPRVINITIGKMVEKLEIHTTTMNQALDDMESLIEERFLRILNSGASVQ